MANKDQFEKVLKTINEIKNNVKNFVDEKNIKELKKNAETLVKKASNDFVQLNKLIEKDYSKVKGRLLKEKDQLGKTIDQVVKIELTRAKDFIAKQKEELEKLQKKFNTLTTKKTTKKKSKKKKVTKKSSSRRKK